MVNDGNSQTQPRRALKRNLAWELSNAAPARMRTQTHPVYHSFVYCLLVSK
jgi:hypothetical protein